MQGILKWLTNSKQTEEIQDDWCFVEELEKEEDIHSSTCTIEPVTIPNPPIPVTTQLSESIPKLLGNDKNKTSMPNLQAVVENRILELQSSKLKYQMRNDLAQIKDKELKYRKLQKLQKRSL